MPRCQWCNRAAAGLVHGVWPDGTEKRYLACEADRARAFAAVGNRTINQERPTVLNWEPFEPGRVPPGGRITKL